MRKYILYKQQNPKAERYVFNEEVSPRLPRRFNVVGDSIEEVVKEVFRIGRLDTDGELTTIPAPRTTLNKDINEKPVTLDEINKFKDLYHSLKHTF